MSRSLCRTILILVYLLSGFISPATAEDAVFGGIGVQVVPTIRVDLVILNVLEHAPAAEKGLLPGDLIFQVDNFSLQGSEFGNVVAKHLWGPVGSSVELFYRRPGIAGVQRVVVERTMIDPRLTVTPSVMNGAGKGGEQ